MRLSRRSNPWPAVADLFAALLVATFAGFVLVAAIGAKLKSEMAEMKEIFRQLAEQGIEEPVRYLTDLRKENQGLKEAYEEASEQAERASAEADALRDELELQEEKLQNFRGAQDTLQAKLDELENRLGRGIDPPPCISEGGRVLPAVRVTIRDDHLRVERIPQPGYDRLLDQLRGLEALTAPEKLSFSRYLELAIPMRNRLRTNANVFGFECVLFAEVEIETDDRSRVATAWAYIDDAFYISNNSELDRFMKGGN